MSGLEIHRAMPAAEVGLRADRRLWLTREPLPRVVEDGDPAAAVLLVAPGDIIPADIASQYDLRLVEGMIVLPRRGDGV
jgi:hypothetical protein